MTVKHKIPIVARGEIVSDYAVTHAARRGGISFETPDPKKYVDKLLLNKPSALKDQYTLTFQEILDYLEELGDRVRFEHNEYLQQAFEISRSVSGLPDSVLRWAYENLHTIFRREVVREIADNCIGIQYLENWMPSQMIDGRTIAVRAFGARSIHTIAGNLPNTAALTIMRNAVTRGDALIKTPSNDPMTAVAIAQTMIDMAPGHPLTRHLAVSYWKGGDDRLEKILYQPRYIEKIVAWGGLASVSHVSRYLQPGIDLITLDPKLSASIIGKDVFVSAQTMEDAAVRLATDIAAFNQEACVNARLTFVECETDEASITKLNLLGRKVQEKITSLPGQITDNPKSETLSMELHQEIDNLQFNEDCYRVYGTAPGEGTVIVSQLDDPVDFSRLLQDRVANIVPVQSINQALGYITAESQTIGVYPESLKQKIADDLAFHGAQRIVSLGYAAHFNIATPQDGIEPLRRMCKWIYQEHCEPKNIHPLWELDVAEP